MAMNYRLLDAGDRAITIEFGDQLDADCMERVARLAEGLRADAGLAEKGGVQEVVPTFRSVTVVFDPLRLPLAQLEARVQALLSTPPAETRTRVRTWHLPVCYGGEYGPDLDDVATRLACEPQAVVEHHAGASYRVAMLGFLPGFAFMTGLPDPLHLPRREEPRVRVPAGSVAIATALTAVYPWESPGGWHLLGRSPIPLFDSVAPSPALLAPGDQVRFVPIDCDEYRALEAIADPAERVRRCLREGAP